MQQIKFTIVFLCISLFFLGCKNDDSALAIDNNSTNPEGKLILFIGNSHTNFNGGLDKQVNNFAQSASIAATATKIAPNGFTLQDHLNSETTLTMIESKEWDYIIIQENTYRAAYETDDMMESMETFTDILQSSGAQKYLFRTWAYQGEPEMNSLLDNAYQQASTLSGYTVINIGNYWKTFGTSSNTNLYNGDQVHPNEMGTYFTAGLFFKKVFNYPNLQSVPYNSILDDAIAEEIKIFITNQNL